MARWCGWRRLAVLLALLLQCWQAGVSAVGWAPRSSRWALPQPPIAPPSCRRGQQLRAAAEQECRTAPHHAQASPGAWRYAVIIDAGSTGSRCHVFAYSSGGGGSAWPTVQLPQAVHRTAPGLPSYAFVPHTAASSLQPLLRFAREKVRRPRGTTRQQQQQRACSDRLTPSTCATAYAQLHTHACPRRCRPSSMPSHPSA